MAYKKYQVLPEEEGIRLVNFLKLKTKSPLSLKKIKKALEKGICKLNGRTECFASIILKTGDRVEVEFDGLATDESEAFLAEKKIAQGLNESFEDDKISADSKKAKIEVVFEDDYFLIIDKPVGIVSSDQEIRKFFPNTFLVHRLDVKTSGLLILAKSQSAKDKMIDLFSKKKIEKTYIAIVDGHFTKQAGQIESFLKPRKSSGKILFQSHQSQGQKAITKFEVVYTSPNYSVVLFQPITGRTHQLRVHALELKHPILGDYQYCQKFKFPHFAERLFLHSWKIEFIHPFNQKRIKVKSPLPAIFKKYLKNAHFDR